MCKSPSPPALSPLERTLEALLFIAGEPLSLNEMAQATGERGPAVKKALAILAAHYQAEGHGLSLLRLGAGWQMVTAESVAESVSAFRDSFQSQRVRLSKPALETLSVIAYNQPVTRSEIEEIRSVRCDRVLETLMRLGLVRVSGRKKGTGNPLLYRTTARFLEVFGLDGVSSLPALEDLAEIFSEDPTDGEDDILD